MRVDVIVPVTGNILTRKLTSVKQPDTNTAILILVLERIKRPIGWPYHPLKKLREHVIRRSRRIPQNLVQEPG